MKTAEYSRLFEGKFISTASFGGGILERVYFDISPSTYNVKTLYSCLKKYLPKKEYKILDIGCGGGHSFLPEFGLVTGVDVSEKSLQNARKLYHEALLIDATKPLPFKDNHFDIAFCAEVFGHIAYEDKDFLLEEVKRVLKPHGLFFMSIETYGINPMTLFLKIIGEYRKYWVDYQGHIGLETYRNTKIRLSRFFNLEKDYMTSGIILPIDGYMILDDKFKFLKIFHNNLVRRILNLFLSLPFRLSLYLPIITANDIVVVLKKDV